MEVYYASSEPQGAADLEPLLAAPVATGANEVILQAGVPTSSAAGGLEEARRHLGLPSVRWARRRLGLVNFAKAAALSVSASLPMLATFVTLPWAVVYVIPGILASPLYLISNSAITVYFSLVTSQLFFVHTCRCYRFLEKYSRGSCPYNPTRAVQQTYEAAAQMEFRRHQRARHEAALPSSGFPLPLPLSTNETRLRWTAFSMLAAHVLLVLFLTFMIYILNAQQSPWVTTTMLIIYGALWPFLYSIYLGTSLFVEISAVERIRRWAIRNISKPSRAQYINGLYPDYDLKVLPQQECVNTFLPECFVTGVTKPHIIPLHMLQSWGFYEGEGHITLQFVVKKLVGIQLVKGIVRIRINDWGVGSKIMEAQLYPSALFVGHWCGTYSEDGTALLHRMDELCSGADQPFVTEWKHAASAFLLGQTREVQLG